MALMTFSLTKVRIGIRGVAPGLMMASKRIMEHQNTNRNIRLTREQEAELHCHWGLVGKKKLLAIPWVNFYKCLCKAAEQFKWQNKKNFSHILAATITSEVDFASLGTADYEVYTDWVRIPPKTGAMVQMARPLLRAWACEFNLLVDDSEYNKAGVELIEAIAANAGKMVGLGPNRPQLKGPYGRFVVEKFEITR